MGEGALRQPQANGFATMADSLRRGLTAGVDDARLAAESASVTRRFGVDGVSYLVVRPATVGTELLQHWTTAGARWKALYRKHAFHLVDPRVTLTQNRAIPLAWRHADPAVSPASRDFHATATASGIGAGVVMSLQQAHGERAIVAWDCREPGPITRRRDAIRDELANLALLGCFLHERIAALRPPTHDTALAATLTTRERECLTHAAHGMTSSDIATKLRIAERTVNFHIGNIVRKLGALNRGEAIARGVALNLVTLAR